MVLTNKVEQHPRRQPAFMQGERRIVQRSQSCYRAWNAGWPVGRSRECSERCLLQRTLDSASCMCDLPLLVDAHVAGAYQYQFPGKPRIRLSDRSAMRGVRFNSLSDNALLHFAFYTIPGVLYTAFSGIYFSLCLARLPQIFILVQRRP